jgi:hypothetical protein
MPRREIGGEPIARQHPRLVRETEALHARQAPERARNLRIDRIDSVDVRGAHCFFKRTSSSGADQGYGLISIRPGSATRGPTPLGQMYSKIGP